MIPGGTKYGRLLLTIIIISISLVSLPSCSKGQPPKTQLKVLCAGSLMVPLLETEQAFEAENPDIDVLIEGHGSIQVIRQVTELSDEADVLAVADHSLIPMMMYHVKIPDTDDSYADWYLKFATNSLGFAYTPSSRYAGDINENNWYEILSRPDIKLGISDPLLDSCGYRAMMLLQLSESYYGNSSIFEQVLGPFNPAIGRSIENGVTTVNIPEIVRPESERIVLRGSSIRMIALLESGDIDYAFEYRSVAAQHQFKFLDLPPEINLGSMDRSETYQKVKCRLGFQRFSSVQPEFTGQPIIYGITIPCNAPHRNDAIAFLQFLLGREGERIFQENHHPLLSPVQADNADKVPDELKPLL
jgi:molybdate/tungstate transport system substrate-binding protein